MDRFDLQNSNQQPGWLVCTDSENLIVCRFEAHKFNETQQVTMLEDAPAPDVMAIARAMRKMADWLRENHYELIF